MTPSFRILLFISESDIRNTILHYLSSKPYEIEEAQSEKSVLNKFNYKPYNLIICEDNLKDTTGFQVFRKLEGAMAKSNSAFFLVLKHYSKEEVQFGMEMGIANFVFTPIDKTSLNNKVDKIYRRTLAFNYYETPRFHEEFHRSPIPMFFSEDSRITKTNEAFIHLFKTENTHTVAVYFHDLFDLNGHQQNLMKLRKLENGLIDHCWLKGVSYKQDPFVKYNLYKSSVDSNNQNRMLTILIDKCVTSENGKYNDNCPVYGTCLKRQASTQKLNDSEIHLTPRETEILHLSESGVPLKQIAAHCGISQRTVEKHRSNIMQKTETHSMMEAILMLRKNHLISSNPQE